MSVARTEWKDLGMWRIKDWNEHYENAASRQVTRAAWAPVKNKQDGDSYLALLDHDNGPAHYGCFIAIVLLASKCSPRGTLVQSTGVPHTAETISKKTHMPARLVEDTLQRCSNATVAWVEWVEDGVGSKDLFGTEPAGPVPGGRVPVDGQLSADYQPTKTPSPRNGKGKEDPHLTSPPPAAGAGGDGDEEEDPDPAKTVKFTLSDGAGWYLYLDQIANLQASPAYAGRVDVEGCLRDLARRQTQEPRLRKPAEEMHGYLENWLGMELSKFKKFTIGGPSTKRRNEGPTNGPRTNGVEKRTLEMLRAS